MKQAYLFLIQESLSCPSGFYLPRRDGLIINHGNHPAKYALHILFDTIAPGMCWYSDICYYS